MAPTYDAPPICIDVITLEGTVLPAYIQTCMNAMQCHLIDSLCTGQYILLQI